MVLHLHRAPRTDLLADALGELLATPLEDPFATELVLVPARGRGAVAVASGSRTGSARRRGGGDGVCAGVEFRFPRSLVAELTGTRDDDPWAPDALAWPLLSVLDSRLDEPWAATLALHLGHRDTGDEAEFRRGRRYAVARRLAGLFASYAAQRPQLLVDWSAGDATDGLGRRARRRPGLAAAALAGAGRGGRRAGPGRAARRDPRAGCAAGRATCRRGSRCSATPGCRPPRSSCCARWPPTTTCTCGCPTPATTCGGGSPTSTGPGAPRATTSATAGSGTRCSPRSAATSASCSAASAPAGRRTHEVAATDAAGHAARLAPGRPAGRRRRARRADASTTATGRCRCTAATARPARSRCCARCCSGCSRTTRRLEPRDILVMCPDIENYAPLITAAFGLGDVVEGGHPAHRLRVQLADRALTRTNPLLGVAAQLLDVAGSRATASAVLDLAQSRAGPPPVRLRRRRPRHAGRLGARVRRPVGVRRRRTGQPFGVRYLQNTWRFGLDRVLTGVAMSDDSQGWLGTALPARRRRQQPGRAGRPVRRVRRPAGRRDRPAHRHPAARGVAGRRWRRASPR